MKKFTKLLFLLILEFIIAALFLGVSENADLASAIIFPPIFAITLYFLIFTTLEVENKSKKVHVIFALLLASVALFSSSIGFHYASNDLNNLFSNNQELEHVLKRLYFLDEKFSHWLMFTGIFGILLAKSKANITCTFLDLFSTSKVVKIRKYRVIANMGGNMIAEAKSAFSLTPKNKAAIINSNINKNNNFVNFFIFINTF